jgi:hypothetical protein
VAAQETYLAAERGRAACGSEVPHAHRRRAHPAAVQARDDLIEQRAGARSEVPGHPAGDSQRHRLRLGPGRRSTGRHL